VIEKNLRPLSSTPYTGKRRDLNGTRSLECLWMHDHKTKDYKSGESEKT
jgi:hypothetical protein